MVSRCTADVYFPTLSSKQVQEPWPELVTKEVMDNLNNLMANIQITSGLLKGVTCLPVPSDNDLIEEKDMISTKDPNKMVSDEDHYANLKDRIHVLESTLITWTKQIKDVLKRDPEILSKYFANPGPLEELDFWDHQVCIFKFVFSNDICK